MNFFHFLNMFKFAGWPSFVLGLIVWRILVNYLHFLNRFKLTGQLLYQRSGLALSTFPIGGMVLLVAAELNVWQAVSNEYSSPRQLQFVR